MWQLKYCLKDEALEAPGYRNLLGKKKYNLAVWVQAKIGISFSELAIKNLCPYLIYCMHEVCINPYEQKISPMFLFLCINWLVLSVEVLSEAVDLKQEQSRPVFYQASCSTGINFSEFVFVSFKKKKKQACSRLIFVNFEIKFEWKIKTVSWKGLLHGFAKKLPHSRFNL